MEFFGHIIMPSEVIGVGPIMQHTEQQIWVRHSFDIFVQGGGTCTIKTDTFMVGHPGPEDRAAHNALIAAHRQVRELVLARITHVKEMSLDNGFTRRWLHNQKVAQDQQGANDKKGEE